MYKLGIKYIWHVLEGFLKAIYLTLKLFFQLWFEIKLNLRLFLHVGHVSQTKPGLGHSSITTFK